MYRRTPLSYEVKKILTMLVYTLLSILVVSSGYFFIKMSDTAENGASFRENQLRQQYLDSENRTLKQQLLEVQSITELKQDPITKAMVEPETTIFVPAKSALSKRKVIRNDF